NLLGPTIVTAQGHDQSITVTNGVLVTGSDLVWLKTPLYNKIGTGNIIGNPLIVGAPGLAGIIANSQGDVNMPTNLSFVRSSLPILASGNINSTGITTINLPGTLVNKFGGDLTLIAGYNFTPSTGGQIGPPPETNSTYTITSQSTGGSINLAGVSINLSTTGVDAHGGNLLAVAHNGSITLGSVTTAATGAGSISGNVTIIGQNGVTTGAITTAGTTPGTVSISAA